MIINMLSFLQIAFPMLFPAIIFMSSFGSIDNINNPDIPFGLRVFKDIFIVLIVLIPFYFTIVIHRLRISIKYILYLMAPIGLGILMYVLSVNKFAIDLITV